MAGRVVHTPRREWALSLPWLSRGSNSMNKSDRMPASAVAIRLRAPGQPPEQPARQLRRSLGWLRRHLTILARSG
jgi:hypothetical protein